MKKIKYIAVGLLASSMVLSTSCEKFLDQNKDPDRILVAPIAQVLTSATVNVGFTGGSDIHRFTSLIMQQNAGRQAGVQTSSFETYLIQPTDQGNLWSSLHAGTLADLEFIIQNSAGSPWYTGIARILKAYTYSLIVDTWGDVPFDEGLQSPNNFAPKVDDDATIYPKLIALLDQGIADLNQASSVLVPAANETIYQGNRVRYRKFANTLKLRLLLQQSESNPGVAAALNAHINAVGPTGFFESNADNFQMAFVNAANARNPIHSFEVARLNQFFPHKTLVDLMNSTTDPRRPFYFTDFPFGSGMYKGVNFGATPTDINFSRMHTYIRGAQLTAAVTNAAGGIVSSVTGPTYTGAAPQRMLTFAEYNFMRAEAALRFGAPGPAQTFYAAGITASMSDAGVTSGNITAYLATPRGVLAGTQNDQLRMIIEEKYVANYGVPVQPWSDWRRTGFPVLVPNPNGVVNFIPRSLFYPENEVNSNPNFNQKSGMNVRVFWDTRP